jgi:hypothetical protein
MRWQLLLQVARSKFGLRASAGKRLSTACLKSKMGVRRSNKSSHFIEIYPSPLSYLFSFSGGVRPRRHLLFAPIVLLKERATSLTPESAAGNGRAAASLAYVRARLIIIKFLSSGDA